jgi:hypothetical protein
MVCWLKEKMRGLVYREAKKREDDGEAELVCFGCNRERDKGKMERRQCVEAVRVAGSAGGEERAGLRVLQNGDKEKRRSWFGFKRRGAAGLCEQGKGSEWQLGLGRRKGLRVRWPGGCLAFVSLVLAGKGRPAAPWLSLVLFWQKGGGAAGLCW